MEAFFKGHAFFTGAAMLLLLLSILCRFMTGVLLKKLLKEAENMSATDNKLLKQCKLKFQNCFELNEGAVNVEVFVEKFMQNIRLGRCSLRLIGLFSGQFLLLSVFAAGIGACLGLIHGETLGQVLPYYLLAFLSLYLYFSISGLVDVPGKQEALKTTVTDFLENRMTGRIVSAKKDNEYLEEEERKAKAAEGLKSAALLQAAKSLKSAAPLQAAKNPASSASLQDAKNPESAASQQEAKSPESAAPPRAAKGPASAASPRASKMPVSDAAKPEAKAPNLPPDSALEKEELEALLGEFLA